MAVRLNLIGNGYFVPPDGYPLRLWVGGQTVAEAIVPKGSVSVSASVYAESGAADVHLALYEPNPAPPSSIDSAGFYSFTSSRLVEGTLAVDLDPDDDTIVLKAYQDDAEAVGQSSTDLEVFIPTNRAPAQYIARLWIDNVTGREADDEDRDDDDDVSDEAALPTGVVVSSMTVA